MPGGLQMRTLEGLRDNDSPLDYLEQAAKTFSQGQQVVERYADMQTSIIRIDENINTLKPVIYVTLGLVGVMAAIVIYKQLKSK